MCLYFNDYFLEKMVGEGDMGNVNCPLKVNINKKGFVFFLLLFLFSLPTLINRLEFLNHTTKVI